MAGLSGRFFGVQRSVYRLHNLRGRPHTWLDVGLSSAGAYHNLSSLTLKVFSDPFVVCPSSNETFISLRIASTNNNYLLQVICVIIW